jgi:hypothetical protein
MSGWMAFLGPWHALSKAEITVRWESDRRIFIHRMTEQTTPRLNIVQLRRALMALCGYKRREEWQPSQSVDQQVTATSQYVCLDCPTEC